MGHGNMFDAQHADPSSAPPSSTLYRSSARIPSSCDPLPFVQESASVKLAGMPLAPTVFSNAIPCQVPGEHGPGIAELGIRLSAASSPMASEPPTVPAGALPSAENGGESAQVSFEDVARRYRQSRWTQAQRKKLERRLHATKLSIGLSSRLNRIIATVQRGLVETLKYEDKLGFGALYNGLQDIQESCESAFWSHVGHPSTGRRRESRFGCDTPTGHHHDPFDDEPSVSGSGLDSSSGFSHQLSLQSRAGLLNILQALRSDPQFLFERLRALSQSQLTALVCPVTSLDFGDLNPLSSLRPRNHFGPGKRNVSHPTRYKDYAFGFERTDCLSILLFNLFASPLNSDAAEARLRLDVWSSACANLVNHDPSRFYPFLGHILSTLTVCTEWKAKPKFELYLMDVLQTGAFLLEHIDQPSGLDYEMESLDPLRTDVAEEFFASAVNDLFEILDDPDGGFPRTILEFGSAVYAKLTYPESRDRFLEYLFVQWFFSKFLYNAITYPEAHGLLLDFHIRKEAREKLLGQVGLQAYSQVFAVLRSTPHLSIARSNVRQHVRNMLSRFRSSPTNFTAHSSRNLKATSPMPADASGSSSSAFVMLSSADILTLLNGLLPRPCQPLDIPPSLFTGISTLSLTPSHFQHPRTGSSVGTNLLRTAFDRTARQTSNAQSASQPEDSFLPLPEDQWSRIAERIRFELADMGCLDGPPNLVHISSADWEILAIANDGRRLTWPHLTDALPSSQGYSVSDEIQSTALDIEGNDESLQSAIVKLIDNEGTDDSLMCASKFQDLQTQRCPTLEQMFDRAMSHCHQNSDFMGAHYWWTASRRLLHGARQSANQSLGDSWVLEPMHAACTRLLNTARSTIERCDVELISLNRKLQQLHSTVKSVMATTAKLRNKMWYMTDVKNSLRYEDAKHVALALKTMIPSSRASTQSPGEPRLRSGTRSLAGSFFQKPELQVVNVIKAPTSQGGPNKLADEQINLTRKWLSHNGIENFCKGEERIHRFCYEVSSSIGRLVGETMAETPVLWASELFQRERTKFEGSSSSSFLGFATRPSSNSSEDTSFSTKGHGMIFGASDSASRVSQDGSSILSHRPSLQSLNPERWRTCRDYATIDTSSVGNSPGRATSSSTTDSFSTFWSAPLQQPQYAASASSVYSRPHSMFSDNAAQTRHIERNPNGKNAFLDELKQALISLLLSDLGSPVWSCGSETDAWFSNALLQKRIQAQMEKRVRIQRFYAEYDRRVSRERFQTTPIPRARRSRSEPGHARTRPSEGASIDSERTEASRKPDDGPAFPYPAVFRRLIDIFSRHSNPYTKLKALRDLRALVVSSIKASDNVQSQVPSDMKVSYGDIGRRAGSTGNRIGRFSFSNTGSKEVTGRGNSPPSPSSAGGQADFEAHESDYPTDHENRIVKCLRDVILDIKPKTLFRDLQFISAFVSADILDNSEIGSAFLQFGLAALSLKEEVCNSMVEIADRIVSQELNRRHLSTDPNPGNAIQDAAGMCIITAKEGNPVAQRELGILYLTHPELLPRVTLPLTLPRDVFKAEMMYRRDKDAKWDPQSMCLALHWMQLSANGGDELARNRLRERQEFESF